MAETPFDSSASRFEYHYSQMRGYIRRYVTQSNLENTLRLSEYEGLRVLDMEGGAGYDADWLASMGHEVVLVESSASQLELAQDRPNLDKASIVQGDIDTAVNLYSPDGFDLVMSHGVLLYQKDPESYLNKLAKLVKPLGALSLLTAGKLGKLRRFTVNGDQSSVDNLLLTGGYVNNMGLRAKAYLPGELSDMLAAEGFGRQAWFGVRIDSDEDNRPIENVPTFHRNRILAEELRLSKDRRRKSEGQLLHFIAGKDT